MRDLIRNILNESFLNEKAARRIRPIPKEEPKVEPEEDYNKTGWIHSAYVDDNGNFKIIWKDDVRKLEKKYKELEELERLVGNIHRLIQRTKRERRLAPGYLTRLYMDRDRYVSKLDNLRHEIESESIDKPIINFFGDLK